MYTEPTSIRLCNQACVHEENLGTAMYAAAAEFYRRVPTSTDEYRHCMKTRTGLENIVVLRITPFVLHIIHYFWFSLFAVHCTGNKLNQK